MRRIAVLLVAVGGAALIASGCRTAGQTEGPPPAPGEEADGGDRPDATEGSAVEGPPPAADAGWGGTERGPLDMDAGFGTPEPGPVGDPESPPPGGLPTEPPEMPPPGGTY